MSLSMINQKLVLTRQKKVLYHCTEEPRISGVAITDCVFCNVIGGWKILRRKQSMLMKPKGSVERYQILSSRVGSGMGLYF